MQKLKLHTPDLTAANIDRIAALFPNCVTESRDDKGNLKRSIDFDLLKQELSSDLVEGPQERYRLDWPGKREALATANTPVALTLRPCREESVDFENTKNLYIEGDNLDALKLLQETYLGKVKMIYIDPPYNTGNDFIYEDDFTAEQEAYHRRVGDKDEAGNRMMDEERWRQNTTSNGRFHSDWLSMIYPRLKLAKNLLADDGLIFISLDDVEVANLRGVMSEVFGSDNFLACIAWEKRYTRSNNARLFYSLKDNILAYRKGGSADRLREPRSEGSAGLYTNQDNDPRGTWMTSSYVNPATKEQRPNLVYSIQNPFTKEEVEHPTHAWKYSLAEHKRHVSEKRLWWGQKGDAKYPRLKQFLEEMDDGMVPIDLWDYKSSGTTDEGGLTVKELFGGAVFDNPKPPRLINRMLGLIPSPGPNDIILDFFSGSATTAHAVMQLNAEDGGKRRHIMVQLPEPCDEKSEAFKAGYKTIAEIGKERIRRAGKKILQEWQAKQDKEQSAERDLLHPPSTISDPPSPPDIGFRVLKIADSNFRDIERMPDELDQQELALHTEHIKPDRTPEDLLFQVLVDWGVDLALPIVSETLHGKRVFFVDQNALAACFDTGLTDELIQSIAARKPLRAVFRDDGFGDDSTRINVEQIFKLLSPATEVKSL
jgi:adenine-specific DNA-methyltransferase